MPALIIQFPDHKPSPVFDRENYRRLIEELRKIMAEPDSEREASMKRAQKMCEGCPFRLPLSRAERRDIAKLAPDEFPCHTEAGYTSTDIQCRGHWELRRRFAALALAKGDS
jgi:hypothetical protein